MKGPGTSDRGPGFRRLVAGGWWLVPLLAAPASCSTPHEAAPEVAAECRTITARDFAVLRVIDGDTFVIMYDGEPTSCRLFGVDAPERGEPGYGDARDELARLIREAGGVVEIDFPGPRKRDNFGRLLVTATAVGRDLGGELVARGLAVELRPR